MQPLIDTVVSAMPFLLYSALLTDLVSARR